MSANTVYTRSTFIGESLIGLPEPIWYDPHHAIMMNKPPVTLITGQPGSGKTYFGQTLAVHSAALQKLTVILDPKGDFLSLKKMQDAGFIENVKVWSLVAPPKEDGTGGEINKKNIGMLDPLILTNNDEINANRTMDVIGSLIKGGLTQGQENKLIPIIMDEAKKELPSMYNIITKLQRAADAEIRNLGLKLKSVFALPTAKLLQSSPKIKSEKPDLEHGTTVISLMGLKLPTQEKKEIDYDTEERLSTAIMGLLASLVSVVLEEKPKTIAKTLIIDEAWVVFGSSQGRALLAKVTLLGRSLNMATILLTQSPSHIKTEKGEANLDTTISTRFAFSSNSRQDNELNCELLGLPQGVDFQSLFEDMPVGTCIMRDVRGQITTMYVLANQEWFDIFNTKPQPKKKEKNDEADEESEEE